ncbi:MULTISPECIES: ABC transporter substrate-binding protein [unclassified Achromobacter]|uniref:ABC transporter substrate-binding protein n=1 Tax=unclassified Achromobacter TaxID=2626865 RepID=UPI001E443782|nr:MULTISPECIES: ABC transporter substrate-binding protein [unclassified Achromobacter]
MKILDPIWTTTSITRNYGYCVYDMLFGVDEGGTPQPEMVDKYSKSADELTWTFTLRKNLKFSDGTPITTADVIASLNRWAQRDTLGQLMYSLMDSMTANDSETFTIKLKKPFGVMLYALSKPSSLPPFIMPERVANTPADTQISDTTASGPYMLKKDEYRPGDKIVFVKNPYYVPRDEPPSGTAGGKHVYVDRLEWVVLKDAQTQANALANGEVDMLELVPAEQYSALAANPQITLATGIHATQTATVQMNHFIPPFNDPRIAKAAVLAVNQEAMMRGQVQNKDLYQTCTTIYPCDSKWASNETLYFTGKPQFAEAKKLLKDAGYDGKPIVLMYQTDIASLNKYPPIMAQLLKNAGFNVDLQAMDWPTLQARRAKRVPVAEGGWNMFITAWAGLENSNPLFFPALSGNGEKGWIGWATDPELEKLKLQFLEATDEGRQKQLATDIQKRVFETGLFIPLGASKTVVAYRKGVVSGDVKSPVTVWWNLKKN